MLYVTLYYKYVCCVCVCITEIFVSVGAWFGSMYFLLLVLSWLYDDNLSRYDIYGQKMMHGFCNICPWDLNLLLVFFLQLCK